MALHLEGHVSAGCQGRWYVQPLLCCLATLARFRFACALNEPLCSLADVVLTGSVHINVHFYEDGNVQLNASNELEAKPKAGNTADLTAAAVLKVISSRRAG